MDKVEVIFINIADINDDYSNLSFLRDEDYEYLKKYKPLETRKEHAASLYLKRKYVGDFYLNEFGKPLSKEVYFNISHSHGLVMMAISKHLVGIDIEPIRDVEDNMKKFISSEEEYLYMKDNKSFFEIWTAKEGLVKAYGNGIYQDIKNIPALPINGRKTYFCKEFYAKTIEFNNYILNVTLNTEQEFILEFKEERI